MEYLHTMVRVRDLPRDLAVPVDLERRARLEARPSLEAVEVGHDLAAVEHMTVVEQVAVEAGSVRHVPGVDDLASHVDQVNGAVPEHRREQRVTVERAARIVSGEPGARPADALLIDGRHQRALGGRLR